MENVNECLAAGRGICLPATAKATANTSTVSMIQYAKHRKQFKIPLLKMEGIQEKLANMIYNTWVINASIDLNNTLLDQGEKPAVISAIMKQQTTEEQEVFSTMLWIFIQEVPYVWVIIIYLKNFIEPLQLV